MQRIYLFNTLYGENNLISYMGRINYDYKGKYLLSGAIRRDGLSVWAPGKKMANIPLRFCWLEN